MQASQIVQQARGIVWDMDGTLVDSMPQWIEVYRATLASYGVSMPEDYLDHVNHLSAQDGAAYTVQTLLPAIAPSDIMRQWDQRARYAYATTVCPLPHAKEVLLALHKRGIPMAIASASKHDWITQALQRHDMLGYFDAICCVDEVPRGKDCPDLFLLAAQRLHLPAKQLAAIDDSPAAMQGIRKASMQAVGIATTDAQAEQLLQRGAHAVIRSLDELLEPHTKA